MHDAVLQWVARHRPIGPLSILDVGGRDVNGTPHGIFSPDSVWTVIDLHPGPNVTYCGDWLGYPYDDWFDIALHLEVAEHTPEWPEHLAKIADHTDLLLFTAAGPARDPHSALDGGPLRQGEHYENVHPDALSAVLEQHYPHHLIDLTADGRDVRAKAWR